MSKNIAIPDEVVISKIYLIRGQRLMIDRDLAELYGVETKRLKEAVRRNIGRFPGDFMFEMTKKSSGKSTITLEGKIVIDATNPNVREFIAAEPGSKTSSEVVGQWAKGAKVVKAFNTLYAQVLAKDPQVDGGNRVIFYSGDDDDAKDVLSGILARIGFAGIDLGSLNEGGKLQRFPGGPLPTLNLIKL